MSANPKKTSADERAASAVWPAVALIAGAAALAPFLPETNAQQAPERLLAEPPTSTAAITGEIGREAARPKLVQAQTGFSVAEIEGEPGNELPVAVELPKSLSTDYLIVAFRGLPEGFSFSSGFRTADNWFVAARQVQGLMLIPPPGFTGSFPLEAQLIRGQNIEPLVKAVRVTIAPKAPVAKADAEKPAAPAATSALPRNPQAGTGDGPAAQSAGALDAAKERQLLAMAKSLLAEKDIAAARLVYSRLARQGSVEGALLLGQSYDPEFLRRYDLSGLEPDTNQAKHWYEIAAKLGSKDASGRLLALGADKK